MPKSGQCQFFGSGATAWCVGALIDMHPQASIGKRDCCGEAIWPRPDDDRVWSITHAVWCATAGTVPS